MAVEFICDGCGKREPADVTGDVIRIPDNWFGRHAANTAESVCSRACAETIDKKEGRKVIFKENPRNN